MHCGIYIFVLIDLIGTIPVTATEQAFNVVFDVEFTRFDAVARVTYSWYPNNIG